MSLHRLLQRGFASLFGYKVNPKHTQLVEAQETDPGMLAEYRGEYGAAVLTAENATDLHYKMKWARCLALLEGFYLTMLLEGLVLVLGFRFQQVQVYLRIRQSLEVS